MNGDGLHILRLLCVLFYTGIYIMNTGKNDPLLSVSHLTIVT